MEGKEIRERLRDIDDFLLAEYKAEKVEKKRDWRTYEQTLAFRVRSAVRSLTPLIEEAISTIHVERGAGRLPELTLKQKVTLLLLKELFDRSNRNMEAMLAIFSLLSDVDVGYKTIERLYSDPEVEMALHNLHVLILRRKGITEVDASGDGTGYSLTISKHYRSETQARKDGAKEADSSKKATFVFSFKLLDLGTKLYVAYGVSFKSEKEAFENAKQHLELSGVTLNSIRLDKYYSSSFYVDTFGKTTVFVMPKKNATLNGSWKWKRTMKRFVESTKPYMQQYYQRENSEAQFSADKRWFGWKVEQRLPERIDTAVTCGNLWHNLFNLYG